jgi:hypothetical protein
MMTASDYQKGYIAVGLFRKSLSMTTLGAVDWRSDKERVARSARLTKREAKKQTKLLEEIAKQGR